MILMIDHDDSFTYNLVHMLEDIGEEVITISHTDVSIRYLEHFDPDYVILSPGPGHPKDQVVSKVVLDTLKDRIPILGVCLGFQILVEFFGGKVVEAKRPMHGLTDYVHHDGETIYKGVSSPVKVTRYHSLIADSDEMPSDLIVTGKTDNGEIMSVKHKEYDIEGVQYHPEAILTSAGKDILRNFLNTYIRSGIRD